MVCVRFLLTESLELDSSVIYSTHVFDGLCGWPTHLLYLVRGSIRCFQPVAAMPEYVYPTNPKPQTLAGFAEVRSACPRGFSHVEGLIGAPLIPQLPP